MNPIQSRPRFSQSDGSKETEASSLTAPSAGDATTDMEIETGETTPPALTLDVSMPTETPFEPPSMSRMLESSRGGDTGQRTVALQILEKPPEPLGPPTLSRGRRSSGAHLKARLQKDTPAPRRGIAGRLMDALVPRNSRPGRWLQRRREAAGFAKLTKQLNAPRIGATAKYALLQSNPRAYDKFLDVVEREHALEQLDSYEAGKEFLASRMDFAAFDHLMEKLIAPMAPIGEQVVPNIPATLWKKLETLRENPAGYDPGLAEQLVKEMNSEVLKLLDDGAMGRTVKEIASAKVTS